MPKLALDIDMVLIDTNKIIREYFKEKKLKLPSRYSYSMEEFGANYQADIYNRFKDTFYMSKEYLKPLNGSSEALEILSSLFDICLVSNRVVPLEVTQELIIKYFPFNLST